VLATPKNVLKHQPMIKLTKKIALTTLTPCGSSCRSRGRRHRRRRRSKGPGTLGRGSPWRTKCRPSSLLEQVLPRPSYNSSQRNIIYQSSKIPLKLFQHLN